MEYNKKITRKKWISEALSHTLNGKKASLPRLATYIIVKELARSTEVFAHTNTTINTILPNLVVAQET